MRPAKKASQNPILQRELVWYVRNRPRWLWGRRIFSLLVLLALIGAIAATLQDVSAPSRELAINAVWVVHLAVVIRAVWAGASTASREFHRSTWESLSLTGVGAWRMFLGNWRAGLRMTAPWMVALGVLRLAMLPLSMLGVTTRFSLDLVMRYGPPRPDNPFPYPEWLTFFGWVPWAAVVAVVSAVLLTVLEVLACTALGVTAGILTRHSTTAILVAAMIRLLPPLLGATVALRDGTVDFSNPYAIFIHTGMALADMGTSPLSRLTVPYMAWARTTHGNALVGLAAAYLASLLLLFGGVYVGYLGLRLRGARRLRFRRGDVRAFKLPPSLDPRLVSTAAEQP